MDNSELLFVLDECTFGADTPSKGGHLTVNSIIRYLSAKYDVGLVSGGTTEVEESDVLSNRHWLGPTRPPHLGVVTYFNTYWRFRLKIRAIIKREDPSLIICQGGIVPAAVREAELAGISSIAIVRGFENISLYTPVDETIPTFIDKTTHRSRGYMKTIRDTVLAPLVFWYLLENRWGLRTATRVVTNSSFMAQLIEKKVGVSPDVIFPHVNCHPVPGDGWGVGFISPQTHKGSRLILELARRTPSIAYKLYGSLDDATADMDMPRNVSYRGWIRDVSEIYEEISILAVPSRWPEPFGRVAAEALQSGIPCIASDIGGLSEVIGNAGILVGQENGIETWERNILRLLEDDTLRAKFRKKGLERGRMFTPERVLPQWGDLITQVLTE